MNLNKKADGGLFAIIVILIIIIVMGIVINIGNRECSKDSQCGNNQYCGSDFKCHKHPIIEKVIIQRDLVKPAFILGLAIIISAWIYRGDLRFNMDRFKRRKEEKKHHGEEEKHELHESSLDKHTSPHSTRLP